MKLSKNEKQKLVDWAKLLFCKENRTQKDIAETVGVSERTINQWKTEGKWEEYRKSLLKTKEELLKELYAQVEQFNKHILSKEDGKRFPDSKEADALKKMTASINDLETELGINVIIDMSIEICTWLRPLDFKKAAEIAEIFDSFIKSKIK